MEGCDTKSIIKGSTASLNSDFSFSETGYLTKVKGSNPYD